MLIPTANIHKVHRHLLNKGILVVRDDVTIQHPDLQMSNLQVMQIVRSLTSRGFVSRQHVWRDSYYYVTEDGYTHFKEKFCIGDNEMGENVVEKEELLNI